LTKSLFEVDAAATAALARDLPVGMTGGHDDNHRLGLLGRRQPYRRL
jgi:hypothetical protein